MRRSCLGCGALIRVGSRCGACRVRNGSTRQWRGVRAFVLARDAHRCHYCGGAANTVDHVVAKVNGGTDRPWNLVAACSKCNGSKGSKSLVERTSREW